VSDFKWFGDRMLKAAVPLQAQALKKAAEMILTKAKQATPVLTGALMRSGTTENIQTGRAVEISFNTPYAHRQHEMHSTKAKYLENAVNANADAALAYIEKATGQTLKQGGA
jgi:hypothetical protein